ncbi:MAG: DUF5654 family protein [Halobacteriota archaeon]
MVFKGEAIDKFAALIVAAFGLIAALAWNDVIKTIFAQVFGAAESVSAMLAYAIIVTILAVIATIWIGGVSAS